MVSEWCMGYIFLSLYYIDTGGFCTGIWANSPKKKRSVNWLLQSMIIPTFVFVSGTFSLLLPLWWGRCLVFGRIAAATRQRGTLNVPTSRCVVIGEPDGLLSD